MYFQDSSSCLLCAGDVHEEQEITTDIGDRNIREVIVIMMRKKYFVKIPKVLRGGRNCSVFLATSHNYSIAFVYLIVIGQEGTSMKIVLKMMPLKKKPI